MSTHEILQMLYDCLAVIFSYLGVHGTTHLLKKRKTKTKLTKEQKKHLKEYQKQLLEKNKTPN